MLHQLVQSLSPGGRPPLGLLVLQPTPFCNLDCGYCYLPARHVRGRMPMAVLAKAIDRLTEAGLIGATLEIAWHAGEPCVLPVRYYEDAIDLIAGRLPAGTRVRHGFQTNATLIDERWCAFFKERGIALGVSLDGPAFIHDAHRTSRRGEGTHAAVMRGIRTLQAAGVDFHVIAVVTRQSLGHADTILDFFEAEGITRFGFNVEEKEGVHDRTSLSSADCRAFERFFRRIVERVAAGGERLRLRERESLEAALRHEAFGRLAHNDQNQALGIVTIGWQGEVSTFSPELLGFEHPRLGSFTFGHVETTAIAEMLEDARFKAVAREIGQGVEACRHSCGFFDLCLGGAPANKLFEHGTLAASETLHCRLTQKIMNEILLDARLARSTPPAPTARNRDGQSAGPKLDHGAEPANYPAPRDRGGHEPLKTRQ